MTSTCLATQDLHSDSVRFREDDVVMIHVRHFVHDANGLLMPMDCLAFWAHSS